MFCYQCGSELADKPCGDEGLVPYCPVCKAHRFEPFGCAILICVFNKAATHICLLQQNYVHQNYPVLVAGFVKKGEVFDQTVRREVLEETGLTLSKITYANSYFHTKSNTLMPGFYGYATDDVFTLKSTEVNGADWVPIDQAASLLRENSTGQKLLIDVLGLLKK